MSRYDDEDKKGLYYVGKWNWFKDNGTSLFHDHDNAIYGNTKDGVCEVCKKEAPKYIQNLKEFSNLMRNL